MVATLVQRGVWPTDLILLLLRFYDQVVQKRCERAEETYTQRALALHTRDTSGVAPPGLRVVIPPPLVSHGHPFYVWVSDIVLCVRVTWVQGRQEIS